MSTSASSEAAPVTDQKEASTANLFVLVNANSFLVVNAMGDLDGGAVGLFHQDTRILSEYRLRVEGQRPSLLSATVSQDNVYFISHLTNHPLPALGEESTPQGVLHIERKRFLWAERMFECITLTNYSDHPDSIAIDLQFAGDFLDMFEVRGSRRAQRGTLGEPQVGERSVTLGYRGLDDEERCMAISFSSALDHLDGRSASLRMPVGAHGCNALYIEVGASVIAPSRERYRYAAAQARRLMRHKQQRGARLKASGRLFQAWLDKSRADLALLTAELPSGPYPYAGVPWYSTPFGRDAVVTAYQSLWLNPSLAYGVLAYLAEHQARETSTFSDAEPGKIMHETRQGEMSRLKELPFARYYGGVDTTPLFVLLAGAYARRTDDMAFIDRLWPALELATQWIENNASRSPDGFVSYARGEKTGLANQGWKDSHDSIFHQDGRSPEGPIALIEVQGYAYRAYHSMAELAQRRGNHEAAEHWQQCAQKLQAAVERRFWMEDQQFYALAIDGHGEPCRVRASNAGHLLFSGLPKPERGRAVARQLLTRPFDSGWGLRTLETGAIRYNPMSYHNGSVWPHDVALCAAGVARYGEHSGAVHILSSIFEAATEFGMRLPELYCGFKRAPGEAPIAYPVACLPQAWAAGSVFMLLQACLGIQIDARDCRVVITQPRLPIGIDRLEVQKLEFGQHRIDITFARIGDRVTAYIERQTGPTPIKMDVRF
ncbi:amylo-alpha-1,6-glucosidase [Pseudomonas sp. HR96]|uniref:amylo-alpha-1,6-glucosidase n=1 Tax=Pseudomonas sp. HR96 TaxID=1027966 RepID=UPI002A749DEE|nr:amylo-alpha-1,6-glucosidase [Pseudomonas sp. HR96]WPP01138.1 amylo-alpha-1,6-glucosidase [Pseudomonas sp. HR96]